MIEFIGFSWTGLLIIVTVVFIIYTIWAIAKSDRRSTSAIIFFTVFLSASLMNLYGSAQFYVEDTVVGFVEGKEGKGILSGRSGLVDVHMSDWEVKDLVGKDVSMICTTTAGGNFCDVKTVLP